MRIKEEFAVADLEVARSFVHAYPFATFVTSALHGTHMPCLLESDSEDLVILSHMAEADPAAADLGGPLLAIFEGPRGYVSASWYERETIPTWNHMTLHARGTPERFDDALPVLRRTVEHFEAPLERPWSLERMGQEAREMADQVIAFRLRAEWWHLEAKLSQDKPEAEWARVLDGLERQGSYRNAELAAAMRRFRPARRTPPGES